MLLTLIKIIKPDVLQTWMYHSDLLGGVAGKICGVKKVIWNIRNTSIPQGPLSKTGLIVRFCAILSHFIPNKIISCSYAGKEYHSKLGYKKNKIIVIPNGFDSKHWAIPKVSKSAVRNKYGLPKEKLIVGVVGRFDPLKGYETFIEAAGLVDSESNKSIHFLMIGRNIERGNSYFTNLIKEKGRKAKFKLMGEQRDIYNLMYCIDIF